MNSGTGNGSRNQIDLMEADVRELPPGMLRDTRILVDLDKIASNMRKIKNFVGEDVTVMAVIKADAYGLGAVAIAPSLMRNGAGYLAVATLSEAITLKEAYPNYPVFILGHTPDRCLPLIVRYGITQTVFSLKQVKKLGAIATASGKRVKVHVKIDTGFHRIGLYPTEENARLVEEMFRVNGVEVEGIFSHLALVNGTMNDTQFNAFCSFVKRIEERGFHFRYKHISDSIAMVDDPAYTLNMVRPGSVIFGLHPFHRGHVDVEWSLTFVTRISALRRIKAGEGVSYDYLWRAPRDSLIATLPVGYADGFPRELSFCNPPACVTIRGQKAPLAGLLCMDQCMVDVTDIPGVTVGDEVILYGDGTGNTMSIPEIASLLHTNKNDIICRLSARPPRIYTHGKG